MEYVHGKNADKVEKLCSAGLDPNFHNANGDSPLTYAVDVTDNRAVIVALIGGGAHIDFRNAEGQTAMHKAAFLSSLENVKTLLELGASPNYRDPMKLTPLYYNMLTVDSKPDVTEMLLKDAAEVSVQDMHGNHEIHQVNIENEYQMSNVHESNDRAHMIHADAITYFVHFGLLTFKCKILTVGFCIVFRDFTSGFSGERDFSIPICFLDLDSFISVTLLLRVFWISLSLLHLSKGCLLHVLIILI
ncbi:unnamed protein product [Anisakis simplex]|uniref:ANK_REP_REGION domain-containing protein n=1 Tax=Anisakis simplex TaxID=6269 RepID=A0A0M3J431_ANISI|nr:unnamed protein product [Anisakis simplex]